MGAINGICTATNLGAAGRSAVLVAGGVSGVHIIDVTTNTVPKLLGVLDTGGNAQAVAMMTNLAVIADGPGGLVVFDVSKLSTTNKLGVLDPLVLGGGEIMDVVVSGSYAYFINLTGDLQIAQILPGTKPRFVSSISGHGQIETVTVLDARAYVSGPSGVQVVDVSNPASPFEVGFHPTSDLLTDCAVGKVVPGAGITNILAYLIDRKNGLTVLDFTGFSPSRPAVFKGTVSMPGTPNGIMIQPPGTFALVASGPLGLVAVNVTNSALPVVQSQTLSTGGNAWSVAGAGRNVFVADKLGGLNIVGGLTALSTIDFSRLVTNNLRSTVPISGRVLDVAASGRSVVLADGSKGVRWMDILNPQVPVEVANSALSFGDAVAISAEGSIATAGFSSAVTNGVQLFEMVPAAGLTAPRLRARGRYATTNVQFRVNGLHQSGGMLLVAAGGAGLAILDVANPDAPLLKKLLPIPGSALGVTASNQLAYVAGFNGLQIVNFSNPTNPFVVGGVGLPGNSSTTLGVALSGTNAVLAAENLGLQIVGVADPAAPKVLSLGPDKLVHDNTVGVAMRVAVAGNVACIADGAGGVSVFDISDPRLPRFTERLDTDGDARSIAIGYDQVLVADDSQLLVLSVDGITPTTNTPPSFVLGTNPITVDEDASSQAYSNWVSSIRPGSYVSESGQSVTMSLVYTDTAGLFIQPPVLGTDMALRFRPATNAYGTMKLTVQARDSGGTLNGGLDTTSFETFITVRPINDPPVVDPATVLGWRLTSQGYEVQVHGLYPGPVNERTNQHLGVSVRLSPAGLLPAPTVNYTNGSDASLVFPLSADWSKHTNVTLTLMLDDDGGTSLGGVNHAEFARTIAGIALDDPPTVTFLSPTNGIVYPSGTTAVTVVVNAVDEQGPAKLLRFFYDGKEVDRLVPAAATVTWSWNGLTAGPHSILVEGTDASGKQGYSPLLGFVVATAPRIVLPPTGLSFAEDTVGGPIPLTLVPGEPPSLMSLRAVSLDTNLIATGGILISGTGTNRQVTFTPQTNAVGVLGVEFTVEDAQGSRSSQVFQLEITQVDDPPIVRVDAPADGAIFNEGSPILLSASATDIDSPIQGLEFRIDDFPLSSSRTSTFEGSWPLPSPGDHILTAVVYEFSGNYLAVTSPPVRIHVDAVPNAPPEIHAPADVTLTEDIASTPIPVTVTDTLTPGPLLVLEARSLTPELIPVSGVGLERVGDPWILTLTPATNAYGSAFVELVATDSVGARATNRIPVTILPVNDPPTVAITSPTDGSDVTAGAQTLLRAEVADPDSTIDSVEFRDDGVPIGRLVAGPYVLTVTMSDPGRHALTAVVTESGPAGLSVTSAPVRITVLAVPNQPPKITVPGLIEFPEDTVSPVQSIGITDDFTPATNLVVEARSRTPGIIPTTGLALSRPDNGVWNLIITPATNASGPAEIMIIAGDTGGSFSTNYIPVNVTAVNDPPSVSWDGPADGSTNTLPALVTLQVTASDVDSPIDRVEFWVDGSRLGTVNALPYQWTWSNPVVGPHEFLAVAFERGASGLSTTSSPLRVTVQPPPNQPPRIGSPPTWPMVEDTRSDPIPIVITDDSTAPWDLQVFARSRMPDIVPDTGLSLSRSNNLWSLVVTPAANANGTADLEITAVDTDGAWATNYVSVNIQAVDDPPFVAWLSPVEDTSYPPNTPVELAVIAADIESLVARVDFWSDGTLLGSVPKPPFSMTWSGATQGTHVVTAVAFESSGLGLSTTSSPVRVTINAPQNQPPVITSPPTLDMTEDTMSAPVRISVADDSSSGSGLTLDVRSLTPDILPASGLALTRSGDTWTLVITPATNAYGPAALELVASDSAGSSTTNRLAVNVIAVDDPPTVTLLSPSSGTAFPARSAVVLEAAAADVDSSLARVEFWADGAPLATVAASPYRWTWTNGTTGAHSLTAVAVEAGGLGLATTSGPVRITIDAPPNQPPRITAPAALELLEDTVSPPVAISVADDSSSGSGLTLDVRSLTPAILPAAGLALTRSGDTWSLVIAPATNAYGPAALELIASDSAGSSTTNRLAVNVTAVDDPPTVALLSPSSGAAFPARSAVVLEAAAADVDSGLARVEFWADGAPLATVAASPYRWTWTNGATGAHILTAVAVEAGGLGLATTSGPVRITIDAPPNQPPRITAPAALELLEDTVSPPVAISVVDDSSSGSGLTLDVRSLTPAILPAAGLALTRSGDTWTLVIAPATNAYGPAALELIASDSAGSSTTNRLAVNVTAVDDPPTVALLSPSSGAAFPARSAVVLEAAAADVDSGLARVEFWADGAPLATVAASPYRWTWTNGITGAHILTAVAVEAGGLGLATTSGPVRITIDAPPNQPPRITAPAALELLEDTVSPPVAISVADDSSSGGGLTLDVRSLTPAILPAAGLALTRSGDTWALVIAPATNAYGPAALELIASDADRASATNRIQVQVAAVNDPPEVVLTSPKDGVVLAPGVAVVMDAAATDPDGAVSEVRFLSDGVVLGLAKVPPYRFTWASASLGTHTLSAVATDGSLMATSGPVLITVTPPANKAPTIAGGGPLTLYRDSVSVPITLTVGDDRTALDQLTLKVAASDTALFASTNLILGGAGAARTLTLAPAAGAFGNSVVEVRVYDNEGLSAAVAFPVTVLPVSELPGGENCFSDSVPDGYGTFNLLKHAGFQQAVGSLPVEAEAAASVELRAPPRYSILSATVSGGTTFRENLIRRDDGLFIWSYSGNEQTLLSKLPFGAWNTTYRLVVQGGTAFSGFFLFNVISNMPPVPRILNLEAGQAINAASAFALSWVPWTGSGTNDRVLLTIVDDSDQVVVSAASDCSGQTPLLRNSAGLEIPGSRLTPDKSYTGYLTFGATQLSVNDRSPLLMLRAYHSRTTRFNLRTAPVGGGMPGRFGAARVFGGSLDVALYGTPGIRYRLESTLDMTTWAPSQEVLIPSGGVVQVALPITAEPGRFYRASVVAGVPQ